MKRFPEFWALHDPLRQNPDAMYWARIGWNAASHAAEAWLIEYSQRYTNDMRSAALQAAAENLRRMRSPRICDCCNQAIPEDAP